MPASWSNSSGAGNRIVIGIIAILSLITLILIIVLATKRCETAAAHSTPDYEYTGTLQLANVPGGTFNPDILLFLSSKTGITISKVYVNNKDKAITSRDTTVGFTSKIPVDEIGQLELLVSAPSGLRPNGVTFTLVPKLADADQSARKTIKYCFPSDQEVRPNVLYTLIQCPNNP